jgi:hypothetical protein
MDKIEKKQSLGGMLIIAVLSFILTAIISITQITQTVLPFSFDKTWIIISDLSTNAYNQQWMRFVTFQFASTIFILVLSIVLLVFFVKQLKIFPVALVTYFMIRVLLLAFLFYFQTVVKGPPSPNFAEIVTGVFSSLAVAGAWIPYIMLSEKSRETFIY